MSRRNFIREPGPLNSDHVDTYGHLVPAGMHGAPSPTRPYQWTAAPLTKRANHHEIKETQNKPRLKITDLMTEDFPFFPNTI